MSYKKIQRYLDRDQREFEAIFWCLVGLLIPLCFFLYYLSDTFWAIIIFLFFGIWNLLALRTTIRYLKFYEEIDREEEIAESIGNHLEKYDKYEYVQDAIDDWKRLPREEKYGVELTNKQLKEAMKSNREIRKRMKMIEEERLKKQEK